MIHFERYGHINDLVAHYIDEFADENIASIFKNGVSNENEAIEFAKFIKRVAGQINEDEETGKVVLGSSDNTDMIPDLAYEASNYMRAIGYYDVLKKFSKEE